MRSWILYTLLRLGLFAAAFALVLWLVGTELWWVAMLSAAVVSLAVSYIFFGGLRREVAADLQRRVERRRAAEPAADSDESVEDRLQG